MYFTTLLVFLLSWVKSAIIRDYLPTQYIVDIATFHDYNTGQTKLAHCYYQNNTGLTKVETFDPQNNLQSSQIVSISNNITEIQFDKYNSSLIYGIGGKYIYEINLSTLTYSTIETEGESLLSIRRTYHNSTIDYVVGGNRKRFYFKNSNSWSFIEQNDKQYDSLITYMSIFSDNHVIYLTKDDCYLHNMLTGQNFSIFSQNLTFIKNLIVTRITDETNKIYEMRIMITYDSEIIIDLCSSLFVCEHKLQKFRLKNMQYSSADAKIINDTSSKQQVLLIIGAVNYFQLYRFQMSSTTGLVRTMLYNWETTASNKTNELLEMYNINYNSAQVLISNSLFIRQRQFIYYLSYITFSPPCSSGFYEANATFCESCSIGCYQCSNSINCTQCLQGFYLNNFKCLSCQNQGCIRCMDSTTCLQCHPQFSLNTTQMSCWPYNLIYDSCLTSFINQDDKMVCQNCQSFAFLQNGNCRQCKYVMIGCIACQDNITCYQCQQNFTLIQSNSSCICQLPNIYNPILQKCIFCTISNCQYCNLSNICHLCSTNYSNINGFCFLCNDSGCLNCSSDNICSQCDINYTLINGVCIYCPIEGCLYCGNENNCSLCKQNENRFLQNGLCPVCSIPNCEICQSSLICSICQEGSIINNNICSEKIYHSFRNKLFQCQAYFIQRYKQNYIEIRLQFNRQYKFLEKQQTTISIFFNNQMVQFQLVQMSQKKIVIFVKFYKNWQQPTIKVQLDKQKIISVDNSQLYSDTFTHQYFRLFYIDEEKRQIIQSLTQASQIFNQILKIAVPSLIFFGLLSILINLVEALQIICVFYCIGFQLPSNFNALVSSLLNVQINGLFPYDIPNPFSEIDSDCIIPSLLQEIQININFLDAHCEDIIVFLLVVLINLVIGKGLVHLLPEGCVRNFLLEKYGRKNYDSLIVQFQSFCLIMLFTGSIIASNIAAISLFLAFNNFVCLFFIGVCLLVFVGHYINVTFFIFPQSYQIVQNSYNIFDNTKKKSISILTYKFVYYAFICCCINFVHFYFFISFTIIGGLVLLLAYIKLDIFQTKPLKFLHVVNCSLFLVYFIYFIVLKLDQICYIFDGETIWLVGYAGIGIIGMIIFIELIVILLEIFNLVAKLFTPKQQSDITLSNATSNQKQAQSQSNSSSHNQKKSIIFLQQISEQEKQSRVKIQVNWMKRVKNQLNKNRVHFQGFGQEKQKSGDGQIRNKQKLEYQIN